MGGLMDIKIVGEEVKDTKETPIASKPNETNSPFNINKMSLVQMFDVKNGEFSDEIDDLLTWAKTQTEDHSPEGLKWALRELETRTGTPPLGEKTLTYLHRYAYLDMESKRIQAEKTKFIKG